MSHASGEERFSPVSIRHTFPTLPQVDEHKRAAAQMHTVDSRMAGLAMALERPDAEYACGAGYDKAAPLTGPRRT